MKKKSSGLKLRIVMFFAALSVLHGLSAENDDAHRGLPNADIEFRQDMALCRIDVLIDGNIFTSFRYGESLEKPVFFPLYAPGGSVVTRGYPLAPRHNERTDHPHHTGLWFNYGDVNGLDFWNNSGAVPLEKKCRYGRIVCLTDSIVCNVASRSIKGVFNWVNCKGEIILNETTCFVFTRENEQLYSIKRVTVLRAVKDSVVFGDSKEGLLGLRVARELEMPSGEPVALFDAVSGKETAPRIDSTSVTGNYLGSNGLSGNSVWGTRGKWMILSGVIDTDSISVALLDHPENTGYPAYWHARGYGLFAVNSLASVSYDPRQPVRRTLLNKGETLVFKYMVLVKSGGFLQFSEMERFSDRFASSLL